MVNEMKGSKKNLFITVMLFTFTMSVYAEEKIVNLLMDNFKSEGAKIGNAKNGEIFWNKTHSGKVPFEQRSCKLCHSANLKDKGEHIKTGKIIKPLSPSVNAKSLNNVKHVNKWFKRNCKWTIGRECSAQEKADILSFINSK